MVVVSVMCGGWVVTCHVTQACVTRVCSWQSWHGACPVSPGTLVTGDSSTCDMPDHVYFRHTGNHVFWLIWHLPRFHVVGLLSGTKRLLFSISLPLWRNWMEKSGIYLCVVCRYLADVWGTHKRFPRAPDLHFSRGHVASCAAARRRDGMNVWFVTCVRRSDPTPQSQSDM